MSESPSTPGPPVAIDGKIVALVKWKARSLVGRAGLTDQDRSHLEQELLLRLLGALRHYRPSERGPMPYAQVLVRRFASNLLRERRAAKRAGGEVAPLPAEEPPARHAPDPDLPLDVAEAVEALPEHLRGLARALMRGTVAEAARELGVCRDTVYARVREIRERAEFRELGGNPPTLPDTSRAECE